MQLADQPKKLVTDYSHGMQKKLAMAAAVIHGPKVLSSTSPSRAWTPSPPAPEVDVARHDRARRHNFFSPRTCLKSWSASAVTSPSFIRQARSSRITRGAARRRRGADAPRGRRWRGVRTGREIDSGTDFLRTVGGERRTDLELSWLG